MKNLIFKSSFHEKLKMLIIPMMLLTLGVGQTWASMGFEDSNNGILFSRTPLGGSKADYRVEHGRTNSTQDAGNVSALTMKEWYAKLYQNEDNIWGDGHMYYRIYLKDGSAPGFTTSNKSYFNWNSWNGGWRYPTFGNNSLSVNVLNGLASGIYYFEYYWDATATSTLYCSNNSNNFKIQFTIKPNALTSFSVSRSGYSAGSGTSEDPYIIARGGSLTLTASGSGGTSDSNSSIKYKYGSDDWTTSSKTISSITSTTKQSITVKGARRHNSQDLGSDESSVTIYYKAETTYTVSVTSGSPSSVYAGANYTTPEITASNVTGYHFDHWSTTGGASVASATTSPTTVTATATGTVTANYEPNEYSITLDDNGEYQGNGSATVIYGENALTVSSHASRTGWNLVGYWTASGDGGSQVTDAAGNLIASVSGFTDGSGNWTKTTTPTTLYAHWNQINSLSVVAGSNVSSVTGSTSPVTLNTKYAISATPVSGYSFSGWTASPSDNAVFDDATAASTNVTVKNGSVTVTGAATENMTTVTVNVSPAGAGTLTLDASAFTPGNTTTAGVATSHTVVASANSGYTFLGWYRDGNAAGTNSTNTYTLKGNGSSGTGTLTAVFASNATAGWYLIGQPFGNNWDTNNHSYPMNLKYRGMSDVYMRVVDFSGVSNKYFKPLNNSTIYGQSSGSDVAVVTGTQYAITNTSSNGTAFKTNGQSTVWCIVDATNKKFWVQTPADYFPVTLSNGSGGNVLSSTEGTISLKTKNYGELATIYYALNESIKVAITAKSDYWIDDISINGSSVATDVNASSWDGWVTMPSANATLTVTYNRIYSLSYNANGGSGAAPATTYHISGTNATAAAASTFTARAYYTFGGWNTAQYITGTNYTAGASVPMTANTTLYAKWTRSVTLNQEDATTTGSTSVTGTYNCATLPAITNPEKIGYEFGGWYTEVAGSGNIIINTSGALQADKYHWTDASGRFDRTTEKAAADLYAKWTQTVTLNANTSYHGSGSNTSATIVYKATAKSSITHCTPATGYHLVGYYTDATGGTKVLKDDGTFAATNVTDYITSGKWTKAGATTLWAHYEPNTYTIHYDPNDAKYVGEATGSMDDQAATWGNYPTLTSNGFTREGYTFAGWATSPTGAVVYSNGQTLSTNLTNDNNATVTLYAKWTGRTYTVTFNARGGSSLSPASKTVTMGATYGTLATVTPPAGYVFDGWYTSAGGGTKVTSATQVTTAVDHTLYAHYIQKAQVYFKNTLGWSKVYVTYGSWWNGDGQGAGNEGRTYHKMQLVPGTTDVYYDDIPDDILTSWQWNVAFDNTGFCADEYKDNPTTGTYHGFNTGEAVFRYDFDKKATMFVPTSNKGANVDGNFNDVNNVQYRSTGYPAESTGPEYTSGYWRTYNNTYSGYTMTYQKKDGPWSSGHKMESSSVSSNVFIYTVHMDANSQYNFAFYKERDLNFKSVQFCYDHNTQITSNNCTNLVVKCEPQNSWMQTTVEGDYVFKLEMKNDGHMYLTVEYPFKANDYKVVYSYTKDGAKTYDSEIIRGRANGLDTISVFIHSSSDASSRSLKIAQCTGINASGIPTWNNSYAAIDISSVSESGVYDFIITQNGSAAASGAYWDKYTGNYYIRTDVSDGGWDLYKYRTDNIMTLSEYSLTQTLSPPYSHYYCRFIGSAGADITYCIATDYSPNISGTMIGDETIGGVGNRTLPATANVRFTWNMETNALRRAYLKNAQNENERFLVLHGKADDNIFNNDASGTEIAADPGRSLAKNELLFEDLGNWIYQVELKAKPNAAVSLIAKYNNADRYLIGSASSWMTIMGGSGSAKYEILAVYDFKTNRLMTVWKPSGDITQTLSDVDVLLIRHAQEAGQAITFNGGSLTTKKVYGALEFRYDELVGHVTNWTSDSRPLMKFFISFPFDVNVSDIFGLNSAYGDAYEIQMYDGAERARKGFFRGDGTTTFWRTLQPGEVMKANEGYCVIMDNDYLNNDIGHVWDNKVAGSSVYLYFPSAGSVGSIASSSKTIAIPSRPCTINRTFTTHQGTTREVNHMNTDSHWNMMGVPIFANTTGDATAGTPGAVFATSGTDGDGNFNYYYQWNSSNNQFSIHTARGETFKSMHSYMVQYYGNVTFTGAHPAASVARRAPEESHQLELQVLNSDEEVLNRAYVELRENACDTFMLNEDVYMWTTNQAVDIYTFAGNYDVSANVLSLNDQTIPVGVEVRKAGTYIFSMPSNFSGTATLIDTFTGARTNLALSDYEVELEKGVIDDRFLLELSIEKVTTVMETVNGGGVVDTDVRKVLIDGVLYIVKDGKVFDARGARIQ